MVCKRIARVFVRKTQYTPTDELCFFGPPGLLVPEVDEVHISCLFTWDKPKAEMLAKRWERVAQVKIGGPAYPSGKLDEFTPGIYIKEGNTFTSRGCPNRCPYCLVHSQEGGLKELKTIYPGNKLMDNNVLACSDSHIEKVFDMLDGQKDVQLGGGIDCRLLKKWQANRIGKLSLRNVAIAFDHENRRESVQRALGLLHDAGVLHGKIHCFVLGGFFDTDSIEKAEERCRFVLRLGATPTAMYYRGLNVREKKRPADWNAWVTRWSWQRGIFAMAKREGITTYQDKLNESKRAEDY